MIVWQPKVVTFAWKQEIFIWLFFYFIHGIRRINDLQLQLTKNEFDHSVFLTWEKKGVWFKDLLHPMEDKSFFQIQTLIHCQGDAISNREYICVTIKPVNSGLNGRFFFWKIKRMKLHAIPACSSKELGHNMNSMHSWYLYQTYYGFNWSFLKGRVKIIICTYYRYAEMLTYCHLCVCFEKWVKVR